MQNLTWWSSNWSMSLSCAPEQRIVAIPLSEDVTIPKTGLFAEI